MNVPDTDSLVMANGQQATWRTFLSKLMSSGYLLDLAQYLRLYNSYYCNTLHLYERYKDTYSGRSNLRRKYPPVIENTAEMHNISLPHNEQVPYLCINFSEIRKEEHVIEGKAKSAYSPNLIWNVTKMCNRPVTCLRGHSRFD